MSTEGQKARKNNYRDLCTCCPLLTFICESAVNPYNALTASVIPLTVAKTSCNKSDEEVIKQMTENRVSQMTVMANS